MNRLIYILLFSLLTSMVSTAQESSRKDFAVQFVQENAESWGFTNADIENMIITDVVHHKHIDAVSVYFIQSYKGIPIQDAVMNINLDKENKVFFHRTNFLDNVKQRVNASTANQSPETALTVAAKELHIAVNKKSTEDFMKVGKNEYVFDRSNISKRNIPVNLEYTQLEDGKLALVWKVDIDMKLNPNTWTINVDANSGQIVNKKNKTLYCSYDWMDYGRLDEHYNCDHEGHDHSHEHIANISKVEEVLGNTSSSISGTYKVYALPAESPIHGPHVSVTNQEILTASPYGWHDVDGIDGHDYTITRGNNVHAFQDSDGNGESAGDEPDGGDSLVFDFEHLITENAEFNYDPAVVNLFYANNMFHDILYGFGFDEAAGNYQVENYSNLGADGDPIIALEDAPGAANNASFGPTGDGIPGFMSMGVWTSGSSVFSISSPEPIAGPVEVGTSAADNSWGHNWQADMINVEAEVALARDSDAQSPTQACGEVVNGDEVAGKIALIDRGLCEFGTKGFNAQNAGAVGVIICNVVGVNGGDGEETINMAAGADGVNVTIPMVFSPKSTCDRIKASIGSGVPVKVSMNNEQDTGPSNFNSSFDNGVIFHEYGHGFNGRVLGGPNSAAGLGNAEQMGEGWSDYFSVAFTQKADDLGTDPRGIGTYVFGQSPNGRGIRRFPYSTDFEKSPYTYDLIKGIGAEPHGVGEVWAAVIWDINWMMRDLYGFDPDWSNTESGNHRALRLIYDGIAFLGGSPGFLDARDALIAADNQNWDGIHNCALWDIFAKRGIGFFADQGSSNDADDGTEDFEPLPTCIQALKIRKSVDDFITAGDPMTITLDIANHKLETETNVVVTDELPEGLSYIEGSASQDAMVNGNMIIFELGDVASLAEFQITYQVDTDPDFKSTSSLYQDIEGDISAWDIQIVENTNIWNKTSLESRSGSFAWGIDALETASEQILIYQDLDVVGTNPVLRFYQKYNTEVASDGGFVEVSRDGTNWFTLRSSDFIRGGYNTAIAYGTFAIPALEGFTGFTEDWEAAYADLSEYAGETIHVRFRFGTDDNTNATNTTFVPGWYLDDFELIDLFKYEAAACISSDSEEDVCTTKGVTLVDSDAILSVDDLSKDGYSLSLSPNPASDFVTVGIGSEVTGQVLMNLRSSDGRVMNSQQLNITNSETFVNLDTSNLPSGLYFVSIQSGHKFLTQKLVIK